MMDDKAYLTREKYKDIIDLERPVSKRAKMSISDRAAQFAPFAALTGYHESVEDTEDRFSESHMMGGVVSEDFYD